MAVGLTASTVCDLLSLGRASGRRERRLTGPEAPRRSRPEPPEVAEPPPEPGAESPGKYESMCTGTRYSRASFWGLARS